MILEGALGIVALAALIGSLTMGTGVCACISTIAHEANVNLIKGGLFGNGLFVNDVHILVMMSRRLASLVMACGRRVVMVHRLLSGLGRGILRQEILSVKRGITRGWLMELID